MRVLSVRDFIAEQDIDLISERYVKMRNYHDDPDLTVEKVAEGIRQFIGTLLGIEPKGNTEYIIVPVKRTVDGEEAWDADLYRKFDVLSFEPQLTMEEMENRCELAEDAPMDELNDMLEGFFTRAYSYAYEFDPWEEALGYDVFMPDNPDPEMAVAVAEDILWELSFNGVTEEQREQRVRELEEMLSEADKALEEGTYVTSELRETYGIEDARDSEEQEAYERAGRLEYMRNKVAETCALLMCRAWLSQQ